MHANQQICQENMRYKYLPIKAEDFIRGFGMTWQYQVNEIYFLEIKLSNDFRYTLNF